MEIERKEAGPEVFDEIKTKENRLAEQAKRWESKIGVGLTAFWLMISNMAEGAYREIPSRYKPEEIRKKYEEVVETNKRKPIFLEQVKLARRIFNATRVEKGEIKVEHEEIKIEKPEAPEDKAKIELTEEEVEKKSSSG